MALPPRKRSRKLHSLPTIDQKDARAAAQATQKDDARNTQPPTVREVRASRTSGAVAAAGATSARDASSARTNEKPSEKPASAQADAPAETGVTATTSPAPKAATATSSATPASATTATAKPSPTQPAPATPDASAPDPSAPASATMHARTPRVLPQTTPRPAALTNPKQDIADLDELERHLFAHRYVRTGMGSLGLTIDPPAAVGDRGMAMAALDEERQELLCSIETGLLLSRLRSNQDILDERRQNQLRIIDRDRKRLSAIPKEQRTAFTRLTTEAQDVWRVARQKDDWQAFAPYLDRIVSGARELARLRDEAADPYDTMLDDNERGTDRDVYDLLFKQVKDAVIPLLKDIRARQRRGGDAPRVTTGRFDTSRQWALAREVLALMGISPENTVLLPTEHPFSDALTTNYAIIATNMREDDVASGLFAVLHEGGHCLYEQGVKADFNHTSLQGGTSMGMHESQSLLFENRVGRSEAFAPHLLELLRKLFPGPFSRVTPHQLYLAANRVEPQPIRVDADELTYPLHVIVRYEIEQLLVSGEAKAADVPRLWAQKYESYLGIPVTSDREGALQDIHWASGELGYFPAYVMGAAISAQLVDALTKDGVDFQGTLAAGDLAPVRTWLGTHIWRYGRSKDTEELLVGACGRPFSGEHYVTYLTEKFRTLYGL